MPKQALANDGVYEKPKETSHYGAMLWLIAVYVLISGRMCAWCQGTLTFSGRVYPGVMHGTNYYEQGFWFRVVIPTPGTGSLWYDVMGIAPAITRPSNIPYNDTPYIGFRRIASPDSYVAFSMANELMFGLVSVQLADPDSPSYTNLPISFVGYSVGGVVLTNTFVTPGGGANRLVTYNFSPEFASGLLWVEIHAERWAMDNLVWVPEPGVGGLMSLGVVVLAVHATQKRRRSSTTTAP
ncbi:MAG: hypothetical protein KatS3mg132_897 [Limisphaera sp.]|nr:MAG: hypothetical protein KatS3mg132_897 [Limisphaera sp.]